MHFIASSKLFENEVLLKHFMEHSYWIKELNRNPNALKDFEREMKVKVEYQRLYEYLKYDNMYELCAETFKEKKQNNA